MIEPSKPPHLFTMALFGVALFLTSCSNGPTTVGIGPSKPPPPPPTQPIAQPSTEQHPEPPK